MKNSVSIVIPVYNEEESLAACLQSIAAQTVQPLEVIVVDNNSTDHTVYVAEQFPFVKVINEGKQGVIHARTTGFNAARGDIIARIDGDSLVQSDWVESIQKVFEDSTVSAVSGVALYYNVALDWVFNAIDLFFRRRLKWQMKDRLFLYGANMAVRRSAWERSKPSLCKRGGMHEDYDLAIHMQELGYKVIFDESLKAGVSSRRIDISFRKFMHYVWVSPDTYAQHHIKERRHMYPIVAVCVVGYWPARILHRGYDPLTGKFSFNRLLDPPRLMVRVDPTANVAD